MKKLIIILLIPIFLISITESQKEDDKLRIRVIANSNSEYDQKVKNEVSNNLRIKLYNLLKEENTKEEARKIINDNMSLLNSVVEETMQDVPYSYEINYGLNYFPQKEYAGVTYEEGEYESLLVKLGESKGDNWWCILFPPLCLIEAEEVEEDSEEVEYDFFFTRILDKILH